MNGKREVSLLVVTVLVVLAIFTVTTGVIRQTNGMMTQYCFEELDRTAADLARQLKYTIDCDALTVKSMARLIASQPAIDGPATVEIMNSLSADSTYISSVELLTPDGALINEAGETASASGVLDFSAEARKGAYLSGKTVSAFDGEMIMRCSAPVVQNGATVAVLYGIVRLARLPEIYKTDIYDGNAYVYLIDGATGDFLLDTWHKTLGNIHDLGARETLPGYSIASMNDDIKNLRSGNMAFVSRTTGGTLYMHYQPLNVNSLSVMITVDESVALYQMRSISESLYRMAAFDGILIMLYMAFIIVSLFLSYKTAQRLGLEDPMTHLPNRIAYERFVNDAQGRLFPVAACVYIDANGLHEINNRFGHDAGDQMLVTIAIALKRSFPPKRVYRIGGDEFVALVDGMSIAECEKKIAEVGEYVASREYAVSVGLSWRENEIGMSRVILEADERMLANKRKYYETHERRSN